MVLTAGYSYEAVDYWASNLAVSASLTLKGGVSICAYGAAAFELKNGAQLISSGTPQAMNQFLLARAVGEEPALSATEFLKINGGYAIAPSVRLRFHQLNGNPGSITTTLLQHGTNPFQDLTMRDCQGVGLVQSSYPVSTATIYVGWTNNVFDKCALILAHHYYSVDTPISLRLRNNLFRGGVLDLVYHSSVNYPASNLPWEVQDNLFDRVDYAVNRSNPNSGSNNITGTYNGFTTNTVVIFPGPTLKTNLAAMYATGALGRFYYSAAAPAGSSLTNLIDAGAVTTAGAASLYHHTTQPFNEFERNTKVDIGFHFIATTNNVVLDQDQDGFGSWAEDTNGDGVKQTSETDIASGDSDCDGNSDGDEVRFGLDPLSHNSFFMQDNLVLNVQQPTPTLAGNRGQVPLEAVNVNYVDFASVNYDYVCEQKVTEFLLQSGLGARSFIPATASLRFRETDLDGVANFSCRRGEVKVQFRPAWSSQQAFGFTNCGGIGPGQVSVLWSLGDFSLRIGPQGTNVYLVSVTSSGSLVTNVVAPLYLSTCDPSGSFPECYPPGDGYPYACQVIATWDANQSSISVISDSIVVTISGSGVTGIPSATQRAQGLTIGKLYDNSMPFRGYIALFESSNSASLAANQVSFNFFGGVSIQSTPAQVAFSWPAPANSPVQVLRRKHGSGAWKPMPATTGTSFIDTTVKVGVLYDYSMQTTRLASPAMAYPDLGYFPFINIAGVGLPPDIDRGRVLLLVDNTLTNNSTLMYWVNILKTNMIADGWEVSQLAVPRMDDANWANNPPKISQIKRQIASEYSRDPERTKTILLLGRVPIPYSGNSGHDGHIDHAGPWVADTFYGDLDDALWKDSNGDGKFDQDFVPSAMELSVARIDFGRMPIFQASPQNVSETDLLIRYLKKDAVYRSGTNQTPATMTFGAIDQTSPVPYWFNRNMATYAVPLKKVFGNAITTTN